MKRMTDFQEWLTSFGSPLIRDIQWFIIPLLHIVPGIVSKCMFDWLMNARFGRPTGESMLMDARRGERRRRKKKNGDSKIKNRQSQCHEGSSWSVMKRATRTAILKRGTFFVFIICVVICLFCCCTLSSHHPACCCIIMIIIIIIVIITNIKSSSSSHRTHTHSACNAIQVVGGSK